VPHLKSPDDVARLAVVQGRLLHAASTMVAPGGTLIYCTCSLEVEEGRNQIAKFLDVDTKFRRRPIVASEVGGLAELLTPDGDLRTLPSHFAELDGIDGFYAARLVRRSA